MKLCEIDTLVSAEINTINAIQSTCFLNSTMHPRWNNSISTTIAWNVWANILSAQPRWTHHWHYAEIRLRSILQQYTYTGVFMTLFHIFECPCSGVNVPPRQDSKKSEFSFRIARRHKHAWRESLAVIPNRTSTAWPGHLEKLRTLCDEITACDETYMQNYRVNGFSVDIVEIAHHQTHGRCSGIPITQGLSWTRNELNIKKHAPLYDGVGWQWELQILPVPDDEFMRRGSEWTAKFTVDDTASADEWDVSIDKKNDLGNCKFGRPDITALEFEFKHQQLDTGLTSSCDNTSSSKV